MQSPEEHPDVGKNIRIIDWLKAELVSSVASLLKSMVKGSEDAIADCLAGIIMITYVLGRRVGISFLRMDQRLRDRILTGIREEHELEKWYGDLSALLRYVEGRKR